MNSTFQSFESYVSLLVQFGFSIILDKLHVYFLVPFGLISLMLNIFSFMILRKLSFKTAKFFRYMRLYVLNNIFLVLFLMGTIIFSARTIFEFANTYLAEVISNYFIYTTVYIFYFYGSTLEICIILERSQFFLPKRFKKVKLQRFKLLFIIIFLISILIQTPFYFIIEINYIDVPLNSSLYRIYYVGASSFGTSVAGVVIIYVDYAIRDLMPLVIKIMLNFVLVYFVRQYMSRIKMEKLQFANRISSPYLHAKVEYSQRNDAYITKTETNQTYIAISMSLFSLLEHFSNIVFYILNYLNLYSESSIVFNVVTFTILVKHMFNFIILYKFNYLFRTEVKKFFKRN